MKKQKKIYNAKKAGLNFGNNYINILMVHPHDIFDVDEPWTIRITNLAEQFVKRGHKVKLIYFPLEPEKAVYGEQNGGFYVIPLCRSCGPKNLIYNIIKMYEMFDWADILHLQKCFYYAAVPVILAAYLRRKPIHYDWDDWETKIFYYGEIQKWRRPIGVFMKILERFIPKLADTVSVSSQNLYNLCVKYGVSKNRICKAPVGANLEKFGAKSVAEDIKKNHRIKKPLVLYLGQLHGGQYAELFVKAAKIILDEKIDAEFIVVGGGYRLGEIKHLANNLGLGNKLIFVGFVPHDIVPDYIKAADVCTACFEDNDITKSKSPLKIAEYLACGKAIVASNVGEIRNMVGGVGILVKPGSVKALAEGIIRVLNDERLREEMGRRAKKRSESSFTWGRTADNILDNFENNFIYY